MLRYQIRRVTIVLPALVRTYLKNILLEVFTLQISSIFCAVFSYTLLLKK